MSLQTPLWHFVTLILMMLALSLAGNLLVDGWQPEAHTRHAVLAIYLGVVLAECAVVAFVLWRWPWRPTNRWRRPRAMVIDLATAVGFSLVFAGVGKLAVALLGPDGWGAPSGLLPTDAIEIAAWVPLSICAGICEEIIFRGYLLQQLLLRTGNLGLAIVGQAVLFGVSHGYQSAKSMALIAAWGVLYGLLVAWRRTLAPGMVAHASLDIAGVILK